LWRVVVGYAILIVILRDCFSLVFLVLGTGSSACGVGDVVMTVVFMLAHFPSLLDNIVLLALALVLAFFFCRWPYYCCCRPPFLLLLLVLLKLLV